MVTVLENKILAVFRFSHQHIRIMLADKPNSFRRLFTDNNAFWLLQHHTQQSTNPGRSGTDDKNSIFLGNFRDACCPKTCCKHITDKQSLFIAHCIRNTVQPLIRIRNSDIFRLTAIYSTPQSPTAIRISTVIHISMLTEKTLTAESFDIHSHPVTRLHRSDISPYLFYHTYHLMPDSYSGHSTRHTAMFNMKITGADATKCYTHDCIP